MVCARSGNNSPGTNASKGAGTDACNCPPDPSGWANTSSTSSLQGEVGSLGQPSSVSPGAGSLWQWAAQHSVLVFNWAIVTTCRSHLQKNTGPESSTNIGINITTTRCFNQRCLMVRANTISKPSYQQTPGKGDYSHSPDNRLIFQFSSTVRWAETSSLNRRLGFKRYTEMGSPGLKGQHSLIAIVRNGGYATIQECTLRT